MDQIVTHTAATVPTEFADIRGRRLAYRRIGAGPALILALRFRGVMDSWDPAFLDALARDFSVITFDYSGLGQSTGTPSYVRQDMARDILDLADALGLDRFALGGWSIGGIAVQVFAAEHRERVSHLILIGTVPPGPQAYQPDPLFLQTALRHDYSLEDEVILFFEPASTASRAAAKASHDRIEARSADRSPAIPAEIYTSILAASNDPEAVFPDKAGYADFFRNTDLPVLVLSGDHEIVFPVENWHALNRAWPTLHILTIPQAGHGPQHQHPEMIAALIAAFTRTTPL